MIDLDGVRAAVDEIRRVAGDAERAHSEEDYLRHLVLEAIAAGHPDSAEMARLALTTTKVEFARWCA